MYIVAGISIIVVSHCILAKGSKSSPKSLTISGNFPSRLYLPTLPNPEAKNRARTSDIEAVLENDLQVIPLAADHDQRNGFQYQPIISRQYSRGFTESPRYSQSAVPNLPPAGDTRRLGSPISNANEVKPITKSQLSREEAVAYSSASRPKGNNQNQEIRVPGWFWCLRRFVSRVNPADRNPGYLPRREILTVNDQENNTQREKQRLQLTPPGDGISRISRHRIDKVSVSLPASSTKSIPPWSGPWSKEAVLIGQPSAHAGRDIKPIFEGNEYGANYDDYNNPPNYNEGDHQLGNHYIAASMTGTFNDHFKRPVSSKIASEITCTDILGRFLPLTEQGYNYGHNTHQHPPTNPILALLLSHYGRYLYGRGEPRVYSYLAANNIHNNKPFGSYKLTADDDARSVH